MSFNKGVRWWRPVAMTMLAAACHDAVSPTAIASPETFLVEPLAIDAIRLEWLPISDENIVGYRIERRANLSGEFATVVENVPQGASDAFAVHIDTGLEPETFYGYRLIALTRFGQASAPSVVRAAKTPPMPGIQVQTLTTLATSASTDPDGYRVTIAGNGDTITAPLEIQATRRFSPLNTGSYSVVLRGMASNCTPLADTVRTANVVNDRLKTIDTLRFDVDCRDPNRGQVIVRMLVKGDSLPSRPPEGSIWRFGVSGQPEAGDTTLVVSQQLGINQPSGGNVAFDNLLPAVYEVELIKQAHHAHCVIDAPAPDSEGNLIVFSQVAALSSDTVQFAATCNAAGSGNNDHLPYRWQNAWSPNPVMPGEEVQLSITLDVSANPEQTIETVGAQLRYDVSILDYLRAVDNSSDFETPSAFEITPGEVNIQNFHLLNLPPLTGNIRVITMVFRVIGFEGDTARTSSFLESVTEREGNQLNQITHDTLIGFDEATLQISGTAVPNEPPTADAGGPYSAEVGTTLELDGSGSSDGDGSIAQYSWDYGDGSGNGSGMQPNHTYAEEGTYIVTLTVTDDDGAEATDQTEVAVDPAPLLEPTARANGPYSGEPNTAVQFSSAGSTDADGTIAEYSWTFGDGSPAATEENPVHTYAVEGDYTARLTVTDNDGLTGFEDASVRIRASGGDTPFALSGAFSTSDGQVFLTLSLDLMEDIDETPVAEALRSWRINSIQFDPAVLEYDGFTMAGSVINAGPGELRDLRGLDRPAGQTGLIALQRLRFNVIGATGASTTLTINLASLVGTEETGDFDYIPMTEVIAPVFTVP